MFARNDKISKRQQKRMLVLDVFSLSCLIIPYIAVNSAGAGGIATVLIGTVLAMLYAGILYICARQFIDEKKKRINFMAYSKQNVGSFFAGVIGVLYLVKLFLLLTFSASLFAQVIGKTLLIETSVNVVIAVLLLVSAYGAMHGIEKRARLTEILYILVMVPLILYLILGIPKIEFTNLTTGAVNSNFPKTGIIWGSLFILLTFCALDGIIFTHFHVKYTEEKRYFTPVFVALTILGVADLLIYLVTVGILGVGEAGSKLWSSVTIMQIIEIPGEFVRRQDKIMLAFWMLSIFNILTYCFFYMVQITKDYIGQCFIKDFEKYSKANKYIVLIYGILAFGLASTMTDIEVQFIQFGKYLLCIGVPQSIIIPLILIGVSKIRRGKIADEK